MKRWANKSSIRNTKHVLCVVHKLSEIEHRASFGKEHLQGQVESSPSPAYLTSERESNDFGSWGGEVGWGGRALNLESSTNREIMVCDCLHRECSQVVTGRTIQMIAETSSIKIGEV